MSKAKTVAELKLSGYKRLSVRQELRKNLIAKLKSGEQLFPGIIGYDDTVIPALCNALLSYHDFILLGLRGQAKTRILRALPNLLDEFIPVIKGSEINDDPFHPVSKYAVELLNTHGDDVEIEWLHRDERYGEKLATPDVTIADLIGDIDPIKAASQRLHYAHEGVIHFGIIPRTNRGVFAINELPDLQPRIQVGLFNIMQEKDIQIRGFPIRIPLDIVIAYSANPEDYTNRGSIITPLKDRIGSQIMTHYPHTITDGIEITSQEAFVKRDTGKQTQVPYFMRELVEQIAFEARKSEFVDQKSGVSVRMTVTTMENLISNAERRTIKTGESEIAPRVCDLYAAVPSITGKVELVYEGEQEGEINVSLALIGKAVKSIFSNYFSDPLIAMKKGDTTYADIVSWFKNEQLIEISDDTPFSDYIKELRKVTGLEKLVSSQMQIDDSNEHELAAAMEFVLDGLHHFSMLSKDNVDTKIAYRDMLDTMFSSLGRGQDDFFTDEDI